MFCCRDDPRTFYVSTWSYAQSLEFAVFECSHRCVRLPSMMSQRNESLIMLEDRDVLCTEARVWLQEVAPEESTTDWTMSKVGFDGDPVEVRRSVPV